MTTTQPNHFRPFEALSLREVSEIAADLDESPARRLLALDETVLKSEAANVDPFWARDGLEASKRSFSVTSTRMTEEERLRALDDPFHLAAELVSESARYDGSDWPDGFALACRVGANGRWMRVERRLSPGAPSWSVIGTFANVGLALSSRPGRPRTADEVRSVKWSTRMTPTESKALRSVFEPSDSRASFTRKALLGALPSDGGEE